ncbi:hypothetical protein [Deminuibacter soli]|uniref:hypothetical protein n=1 Tax=Deminuibacter soli TaxID=2291815 RepID=UPI0011C177A0|nr:hypothetical protein [Deminuibacter soli]
MIEDLEGAAQSLYPLRELQSKNKLTKRVVVKDRTGQTQTIDVTVEGPVCVAGCTTKESIYEDNANRSILIYLDDSKEQDARIMQRQKQQSAGTIDYRQENSIKALLQNCQRMLEPVQVRNPYALQLQIPAEVFKVRRAHAQDLQFIEAVTFYHQYQRVKRTDKQTGEQYIETSFEDVAAANELMKVVLLRKSDELNHATRHYLELVKGYLQQQSKASFTTKEIRSAYKLHPSNQKRYMLQLLQTGYIQKVQNEAGIVYEVVSHEEYLSLQDRVKQVLDSALERLKVQGLPIVQQGSEPSKTTTDKGYSEKFKSSSKQA